MLQGLAPAAGRPLGMPSIFKQTDLVVRLIPDAFAHSLSEKCFAIFASIECLPRLPQAIPQNCKAPFLYFCVEASCKHYSCLDFSGAFDPIHIEESQPKSAIVFFKERKKERRNAEQETPGGPLPRAYGRSWGAAQRTSPQG